MNIVKFYQRDTGSLKRVKVSQGRPLLNGQPTRRYYPVDTTERLMANAGYFRKRPAMGVK